MDHNNFLPSGGYSLGGYELGGSQYFGGYGTKDGARKRLENQAEKRKLLALENENQEVQEAPKKQKKKVTKKEDKLMEKVENLVQEVKEAKKTKGPRAKYDVTLTGLKNKRDVIEL
jgi:hypothetical protein